VSDQIASRTDGVPLFVEEVARTLSQRTLEVDRATQLDQFIPTSLEETLIGRLDRAGSAKEVAQVAAVIGRSFHRDVLLAACQMDSARLNAALATLANLGIIERVRGSSPESYTFRHVLLRDAAYSSLLRERRRELHDRVARALPIANPDSVAIYPEILAHHLTEAGRIIEAAPLWIEVARRSLARSALTEATSVLQRALTELEKLSETTGTLQLRVQVSRLLGPVLIGLKGASSPETQRVYNSAYEICQRLPNSPEHFPILWGWWRISPYSPERAPALLKHAQTANDPELLLEAHHCSWANQFSLANFKACREHMKAGLTIYDTGDFTHHAPLYGNHDAKVCAHGNLSQVCWMEGRLRSAFAEEGRSLAWAEKIDHVGSRVHAMGLTLLHRVYRRDYQAVYERSSNLMEFTSAHGMEDHRAAGLIFQGWVLGMQEDPNRGLKLVEDGLARQRQIATEEDLSVYLCLLSELLIKLGRPEEAVHRINLDRPSLEASKIWIWYPELLRVLGEATLAADPRRVDDVRQLYKTAADLADEQNAHMLGLRIALSRARLGIADDSSDMTSNLLISALRRIPEADASCEVDEAQALLRGTSTNPFQNPLSAIH
jgi:predicted ATPase